MAMIARSAALAQAFEERLFGPDISRSKPGEQPAGIVALFLAQSTPTRPVGSGATERKE
jgi:hypothetical protein